MRFQPVKSKMMQLTHKRINKINASYTIEGTVLENVDRIKSRCHNYKLLEVEYPYSEYLYQSQQNTWILEEKLI